MASANFIVTSLPDYVENNRDVLLKNMALVGTETRRRGITIQTGIKYKEQLNYLEVDPTLQDGKGCGFNAQGSVTLTDREITTALIKVNMDICPDNLIGKWAEYLVRIGARSEELPFERYIMDGVIAEINKKIEKLIWQGDTSQSGDNNLKWIDGWLKLAGAEGEVIDESIASGSSAYAGLLQVYQSLPDEVTERGAEIYVSPSIYRAFMQDMVAQNFFHYAGPDTSAPGEFYLPGTDAKVVKTPGLAGSLKVVGTFAKNLVYGCDMQGDAEEIKLWFSDDDDLFKLKVKWNSGVQFYFPDMVVLGTFAAAPTIPSTQSDSLSRIADGVEGLNSDSKVFKTQAQS